MASEIIAATATIEHRERMARMRQLAAPVGLGLAAVTVRVQRLIAIQEIRTTRAYRGEDLTWDQYCTDILGESPHTVEEQLADAANLGVKLFALAEWAGLKRADFRLLRNSDGQEIRLLEESNELVLGDDVIPIAPENRDRITEAFLELLQKEKAEKAVVAEQLGEAEATIAKGRTQIEAKEAEISEKEKQLQVAASVLAVMRNDHPLQAEADSVEIRLAELIQKMKNEEFDKAEAAKIHRRLSGRVTDLARYAHGALLDPDAAFARLSPEMQQIIRDGEAEHANDPYLTGDEGEEVGDEE